MQVIIDRRVSKIIRNLDKRDILEVLRTIDLLRIYGNKIKMPISRPLGSGIFELRVLTDKWFRLIYVFHSNLAIIVHIVIKKSNRLSNNDLRLSKARTEECKKRY